MGLGGSASHNHTDLTIFACLADQFGMFTAALRAALSRLGAVVVFDSQVLVSHASRLFDEQVNLCDEDACEETRHLVKAVAYWCRRV